MYTLDKKNDIALGIDVGSTTVKVAVIKNGAVAAQMYERHYSKIKDSVLSMLEKLSDTLGNESFSVAISGSAGLGLSEAAEIPFIQEVWSTSTVIKKYAPDTSVVIELGGEDAKIIFFEGG